MVTFLALVYIHMQMVIVDLAYQGKAKEKQVNALFEQREQITHAILSLRSSTNLGGKMLEENAQLQFADPDNVVLLTAPPIQSLDDGIIGQKQKLTTGENPLLSLLSFGSTQAEARTRK